LAARHRVAVVGPQIVDEFPLREALRRIAGQDGTAWRVIVDTAREHDLDFVVLGAGGHHTRGHRLLGGVAEKVLRSATCPVFVIPEARVSKGAAPS
jgi:nucleotide-binding universal stress UspA family protein